MRDIPYVATALAPGSCGELVQGTLDGISFLVTCPVALYSRATVRLLPGHDEVMLSGQKGTGGPWTKAEVALRKTLESMGLEGWGARVEIESRLPRGKGMASSTADVCAAIMAAGAGAGRIPSPEEVARIALSVEPSDGIMFPGIALFDHVTGRVQSSLGDAPPLEVLVFDYGGEVDTIAFNNRKDLSTLNVAKEARVRQALSYIIEGIERRDPRSLGRGATMSALANQDILVKPGLEDVVYLATGTLGAVGVCVAHSGTVIGVLFEALSMDQETRARREILKVCPGLSFLFHTRLTGGGIELEGGA